LAVWSLLSTGVILVNLITKRNPWERASLDDLTYDAYLNDRDYLRKILPFSIELNDLLKCVFEPDPEKRIKIEEVISAVRCCEHYYDWDGIRSGIPIRGKDTSG